MTDAPVLTNDSAGTLALGGDIEVRRLGYGAMRITGEGVWGPPKDVEGAKAVLKRVPELGVTLIDTADSYGPEVSEELIAEVLHPYDGLTIATKGGLERTGPGQCPRNGHPDHLKKACEGSLWRLKVDQIDIYQLHSSDDDVPYEESVGAVGDLQAEGKVKHLGISNVSVDQLEQARGIIDVVSVQTRFNLGDRDSEGRSRPLQGAGHRLHPLVSACGRRPCGAGGCGEGGRREARRVDWAGRTCMAPAPLGGDAADPRHVVGRPP